MSANSKQFIVEQSDTNLRLDRFLAGRLPDLSRTRIQELIAEGCVHVNGAAAKPSHRIEAGQRVEIKVIPRPPLVAVPEAIPLDILYEDEDVIVVNKPAGMTVHVGAGVTSGTLVNALLARTANLSGEGGPLRPGIVHRLDKATSGALVVARNDLAHRELAAQFAARTVGKTYVALLHGRLRGDKGVVDLPIARDPRRRTRMTARRPVEKGRAARTDWRVLLRLNGFTLVEVALHTGRTHQIRVHFSAIGHPVVGDTLYGAPREIHAGSEILPPLGRNFLHAARIGFKQPGKGVRLMIRAPLPAELISYLRSLAWALGLATGSIDPVIQEFL